MSPEQKTILEHWIEYEASVQLDELLREIEQQDEDYGGGSWA